MRQVLPALAMRPGMRESWLLRTELGVPADLQDLDIAVCEYSRMEEGYLDGWVRARQVSTPTNRQDALARTNC